MPQYADNEVRHTEVKFCPEVKSQTGLGSPRVSCKRALKWKLFMMIHMANNWLKKKLLFKDFL